MTRLGGRDTPYRRAGSSLLYSRADGGIRSGETSISWAIWQEIPGEVVFPSERKGGIGREGGILKVGSWRLLD